MCILHSRWFSAPCPNMPTLNRTTYRYRVGIWEVGMCVTHRLAFGLTILLQLVLCEWMMVVVSSRCRNVQESTNIQYTGHWAAIAVTMSINIDFQPPTFDSLRGVAPWCGVTELYLKLVAFFVSETIGGVQTSISRTPESLWWHGSRGDWWEVYPNPAASGETSALLPPPSKNELYFTVAKLCGALYSAVMRDPTVLRGWRLGKPASESLCSLLRLSQLLFSVVSVCATYGFSSLSDTFDLLHVDIIPRGLVAICKSRMVA